MSLESENGDIWIIKRDGVARLPAYESDKMLLLAEPPRCNVATKSGYPSKRETVEPCYGERKCKLTLPNINPCDGSIDSIALCACVCVHAREREEEARMCVGHLIFTETCISVIGCSRHMHVLRFPYFATGLFQMWCNHFIMVMEIGFNFLLSAAARWFTLSSAWRGKKTASERFLAHWLFI